MNSHGNMAAMLYGIRTGSARDGKIQVPIDNEVLYGHIESLGYQVHISELEIS